MPELVQNSKLNTARLSIDNREFELPIVSGTENELALNIGKLRADSGFITLDHGFVNTGATTSAITYLDGEKGVLRYRGYAVEDLARHCDFVEVCYD